MTERTTADDHATFAQWDAAYVLGALSPADRGAFEGHLAGCPRCTRAVAELAVLPGLLGRVDAVELAELLDQPAVDASAVGDVASPRPAGPAPAAAGRSPGRPRVRRRLALAAAAAVSVAALVSTAVLVREEPATVAVALQQVTESPVTADVRLHDRPWGTEIDMTCGYADDGEGDPDARWSYELVAVDRAGAATRVASWTAERGSVVRATGSTHLALADIAAVQVRTAGTGRVLLNAELP